MNFWIPVADRLPSALTPVVVWVVSHEDGEGGACVARWNAAVTEWEFPETPIWKEGLWSSYPSTVTHWAELPPGAADA
jgi:hypothetical protein